jgi:hypothetical protein
VKRESAEELRVNRPRLKCSGCGSDVASSAASEMWHEREGEWYCRHCVPVSGRFVIAMLILFFASVLGVGLVGVASLCFGLGGISLMFVGDSIRRGSWYTPSGYLPTSDFWAIFGMILYGACGLILIYLGIRVIADAAR